MSNALSLFILFGLILIAAFYRLSAIAWTVLIGVPLVLLTLAGFLSPVLLIIVWLLYLCAALFANLHKQRQQYVVKPLVKKIQKQIPAISDTERIAIEAGDTWWEKELFCGNPHWKKLLDLPKPALSDEEQNFLDNQVEHLCSILNDWHIVYKEHDLPPEVWNYLKKEKFFGLVIPKKYEGKGFSALAHSTIITKIASRSVSAAVTTMVPNSLGPAELLLHYGTDEQKNYYLPRLAKGLDIPCFALTGPDAGSDAGSISDTGIICREHHNGKEILGMRLNWDKRYITLAPVATVLGLAIHLYDPDHILGKNEDVGITLCLIPTSHEGVEIGNRHYPMYQAFMNGTTRGKDVFVPLDWIIGGVKMAGQGWRMLMECLSIGRSISLPALSTGSGKIAYRLTGAYSRIRRQFNIPIASFEGIEEALGFIAGFLYLLESARMLTVSAIDQKINPSIVSAMTKYHLTEMCRQVISHAMDIHAGHMIQVGPRNLLANIYYSIPISITVEGANILTRNLIIFGQGAIRCHPYLLKEIELMSAAPIHIKSLDKVLMSHIGYFISNFFRSLAYGLTGGLFIFSRGKNKMVRKYKRQLTRMSTALALLADASLLLLGGSLKRRERISARLGDIMSQLYLASAVLKYYHDQGYPDSDADYVRWALQYCLYKIQVTCDELSKNFPIKWLGHFLRAIIFPFGRSYFLPNDKLHKSILTPMLTASTLRDRLTNYCFVSSSKDDLTYLLDKALKEVATVEPLWKKVKNAVQSGIVPPYYNEIERIEACFKAHVLTSDEARIMRHYEELRSEIIKVNEFSFNLDEVLV